MEYVSEGGSDQPSNLLPLCPNCHSLHHRGEIPRESIRAWKMLLLALNEAFDGRQVELLLMLDKVRALWISSDSVANFAGLLASGMVCLYEGNRLVPITHYHVALSEKGQTFVSSWKRGEQTAAVQAAPTGETRTILPFGFGFALHDWGNPSPHATEFWASKEKESQSDSTDPQNS